MGLKGKGLSKWETEVDIISLTIHSWSLHIEFLVDASNWLFKHINT